MTLVMMYDLQVSLRTATYVNVVVCNSRSIRAILSFVPRTAATHTSSGRVYYTHSFSCAKPTAYINNSRKLILLSALVLFLFARKLFKCTCMKILFLRCSKANGLRCSNG